MHTFLILFQGGLGGLAQFLPIVLIIGVFYCPIDKASAETAKATTGNDCQSEGWRSSGHHRRRHRSDHHRARYQFSDPQRRQVDSRNRAIGGRRHRRGRERKLTKTYLTDFAMKKKNLLTARNHHRCRYSRRSLSCHRSASASDVQGLHLVRNQGDHSRTIFSSVSIFRAARTW